MAKQIVNIGTSANDRTGDSLRSAFNKINENFTELYTELGINDDADLNLGAFEFAGSVMTTTDSSPITIAQNLSVTSDITVGGDIIPNVTEEHNLGSSTHRFRDLYLSGSTIDLGGTTLSVVGGELQLSGIKIPTTTDLESSTGDITFTDTTISAPDDENITIQAEDINLTAGDDVRITGADLFQLRNTSTTNHISIRTDYDNEDYVWEFRADGAMSFPDNTRQTTAYTGPQTTLDGDVTGSVFADDSTVLVDGVDGKVVGNFIGNTINVEEESDLIINTSGTQEDTSPVGVYSNTFKFTAQGELIFDSSFGEIKAADGAILNIQYLADSETHWSSAPETVKEALDRIAAAIYAVNGNTPI